jgi:chemotaxis protein MotB
MGYDTNVARALKPPSKAPWFLLVLTIGAAGAGGYRFYEELQRAKSERDAAKGSEAAAGEKLTAASAAQKELTDKVEKLETDKAELTHAKEELSKDVAAKEGELAQLKGTYENLQEKMKDEIAKGDIVLSQDGGRLRVGLVDKILFDSGEAAISKRGEGVLARVGAVLASIDDKQIQVSGHTDRTPISDKLTAQFPTNWELSAARAINVVRFLSEKAAVPPQRLVASGYGEFHPVASNKSAAGRARNRRIEILLTPSLAPKAIDKSKLRTADAQADNKPEPKSKAKR